MISIKIGISSTSKTNISCFSNLLWANSTAVASKLIRIFNFWNIFRLYILSHLLYCYFLNFSHQKHWIFFIVIMMSFLLGFLLNTFSTSKFISFLPFQPIIWKLKSHFTFPTFWILLIRNLHVFYCLYFNINSTIFSKKFICFL